MVKKSVILREFYCIVLLLCLQLTVKYVHGSLEYEGYGPSSVGTAARLVKKEERKPIVDTEFGSISAVDIDDGIGRNKYHLQFITMEPNSLFLPVLLHSHMVFYVHTGSGRISWTEGDDINNVNLQRGDVYRLKSGTLFYLNSNLEPERPRFRMTAIFASPDEEELQGPSFGPYSSINDLVRGFDKPILQAAFQVSEEVIDEITSTTDTPAIVQSDKKSRRRFWEEEILFINALFGIQRLSKQAADNKKKHTKTFNFFKEDPDFESSYGWSKVVTKHDLHALHGSDIGVFMVNLTKGSIMGPHWNPVATEVSVVLEGEGMIQVVCPSALTNKECKNTRIRVEEGDVFTVPRFHPMAQTSFNNGSLVFMGFSTTSKKNHPQFLAGKASVLQALDKLILGVSFNVPNTTVDQLLAAQNESIILGCTSCAEEQEMVMEEEIEKQRREEDKRKREEEEAARRREEEERKRQEEEARKRREEEEERKRHEEEEARKRKEEEEERKRHEEEEARKREEEERKREEEEARKKWEEEEERKRREEEEERRRQEEEERKWEEEEARRREVEEEEKRRREEEKESEREEEERKRHEEQEKKRQEEEEMERKREEEEEQKRREEEERRKQEEEEKQRQQEQVEEEMRREEEQKRQEEEEQRRRAEEEQRRREKEEEQKRQQEEEERKRQEEEEKQRRRQEEEEKQQQEEERQQEKERKEERQKQEEQQRREQDEKQRRQEEQRRKQEQQEEERRREEEMEREEERGRGQEESEEEIARREEEERVERQREEEEVRRQWVNVKLRNNKQDRGKQVESWLLRHQRKEFSRSSEGPKISRIM